jgi:hypothetical protein
MVIWQDRKIAAFVQLWSVIMRIELYPPDFGKSTIKSIVTVLKGRAVLWVVMSHFFHLLYYMTKPRHAYYGLLMIR